MPDPELYLDSMERLGPTRRPRWDSVTGGCGEANVVRINDLVPELPCERITLITTTTTDFPVAGETA